MQTLVPTLLVASFMKNLFPLNTAVILLGEGENLHIGFKISFQPKLSCHESLILRWSEWCKPKVPTSPIPCILKWWSKRLQTMAPCGITTIMIPGEFFSAWGNGHRYGFGTGFGATAWWEPDSLGLNSALALLTYFPPHPYIKVRSSPSSPWNREGKGVHISNCDSPEF